MSSMFFFILLLSLPFSFQIFYINENYVGFTSDGTLNSPFQNLSQIFQKNVPSEVFFQSDVRCKTLIYNNFGAIFRYVIFPNFTQFKIPEERILFCLFPKTALS